MSLSERVSSRLDNGEVLRLEGFLTQQLDTVLLAELAEEIAEQFADEHISRILTVETSGIALATAVALRLRLPLVIAKKQLSLDLTSDEYLSAVIYSSVAETDWEIVVRCGYLLPEERVLIVDDTLQSGEAVKGLIKIVERAEAQVAGVAVVLENIRSAEVIRARGYRVFSVVQEKRD